MSHKAFKLTADLGDDMVWVCKARCHSRREKNRLTQKYNLEYASTQQQQTQKEPKYQNPSLSQGQRKQLKNLKSQTQGTRQQLNSPQSSQKNQAEQENRQKIWNRCLYELQQIHPYQREIHHEDLQKQYQHLQQHVQPEPFHWQFTDEMQKFQEKLLQGWNQQLRDRSQKQLQTEPSHNEDECPIPLEYRQLQDPPAQKPLNSQHQQQVPPNLIQNRQAQNQHRQQQAHYCHQLPHVEPLPVLYHSQPQYQVCHHPRNITYQLDTQDILRTQQAKYQHLDQQIQQLRWKQKQFQEAQNQKRAQSRLQQRSQRPTEWQQAQFAHHGQQLQLREGEKETWTFDETMIPDHPPFPFVMDGDSDSEDERDPETENNGENGEEEEDDLESESGFVMI
ncbi:uncharacterized protein EURHEDRAFT_548690 [Aspergillus ruber CBS 135680]|uniref:Uncharacterized protein n=1 Tax=Aspergillus ruber (strain CBS 135680) TaxID=1388766 RepID=A0A017S1Z4_ASPRC|nr:uncharacterized protein EURHEDRAFT_548690 [Aspergillus ruber CBS 135680]EYE90866.1 hypothetical protein EURHEDRAFT_548690 [Aspergillus ruber CBS 135680]